MSILVRDLRFKIFKLKRQSRAGFQTDERIR